jgi:putative NADPH-quinone reductase
MKTLVILGHPDETSFNGALAQAFLAGAKEEGMRLNSSHLAV